LIVLAGLALVTTASLSLILPLAVRRVVDGFSADRATQMDQYFGAAIGIALLLAIGTGCRYYFVTRLGERVIADIRISIYNKMIGMSPQFFERVMTGEVISRITTDTTLILSVISSSVSIALRNLLIFLGGMALMLLTSLKLTSLVLLIVPLVIVPIIVLGRRVRGLSRENQDKIAESAGNASETLLAAQTVQAFTHEAPSKKRFSDLTELAFDAARKRIGVRALMTVIVIFMVFTGVLGVLWMGARDVRSDIMSPGELVQFVIYAVLVAGAVGALSEIWGELQRAAGATERLAELIDAEDNVSDPVTSKPMKQPVRGALKFDEVSFNYPSRPDMPALKGMNLSIKPGETIALVGPSGAGKSTVFQLVLRFFDPTSGSVLFDGIDIKEISRDIFRKEMAYVPQDPVIFATSAKENIRFGRPDATDDEVVEAAKAAAAHTFLTKLPDGYDSFVGERGVMLSGGQKQRIAIARAILRDAPVLLLDEATSALDAESELAVQKAVELLAKDRTTLIVAHRLATVKKADRIVVMDEGEIVATGTHAELVKQGGLYARLAKLQFTH
jgi:ATP-binding cassette subfamily B protein